MDLPETRCPRSGDVLIAYRATGSGVFDLVFLPGFVSNLDPNVAKGLRSRYDCAAQGLKQEEAIACRPSMENASSPISSDWRSLAATRPGCTGRPTRRSMSSRGIGLPRSWPRPG